MAESLLRNQLAGYQLVSEVIVETATTDVDFTSLNFGKEDDLILVVDYKQPAFNALSIFFNGNNTATNYYIQRLQADGTSVTSARGNSATLTGIAGANNLTIARIKLTNNGYFVWQSNSLNKYSTTTSTIYDLVGTSTFTGTSITSIRFNAVESNNIAVGSRFQLYKRVAPIVADITVSSATTLVDITGLNITKDSEYMLVADHINGVADFGSLRLFANDNTTATNYWLQNFTANGTAYGGARNNTQVISTIDPSAKSLSITNIKLTNNGYYVFQSYVTRDYGGNEIKLITPRTTSTFTLTEITKLTIASQTNAIGIGSRFQLIKLK